MREIRTYGSEGGEAPQGAFPTLIQGKGKGGVRTKRVELWSGLRRPS
ncbi:hypothetical protein LNTAR_19130 [Lentisphaera araneosa HTCC2155]|uniref:Uncharacterized protein n=1 Tax=Lentisphaera araneosa HTCC2155 TaxID=313628 RepID=A6DNY2_9BACT|nr:hypothetical protein LNTAR_19130 [Lentisphaera araneosa HTCC2155]